MLIERDNSLVVLVDVQEKLTPLVVEHEQLIKNCQWVLGVANVLKVPVVTTEQYPKGLGNTIPELLSLVGKEEVEEKLTFSCVAADNCWARIATTNRKQAILIGIETHVCVLQTALQLLERGREVFVVADAVSSRSDADRQLALRRMRGEGVNIVTREMVAFEWLRKSGTDEFKQISQNFLK